MPDKGLCRIFVYLVLKAVEILLLRSVFSVENICIHGLLEVYKITVLFFIKDEHLFKRHLRMLLTEFNIFRFLTRLGTDIKS